VLPLPFQPPLQAADEPPPLLLEPGSVCRERFDACDAAIDAEAALREFGGWVDLKDGDCLDDDEEYQEDKIEMELKLLVYKRALQRLARARPDLEVNAEQDCLGHEASGPLCPCGSGARIAGEGYPSWLLQTEALGFCCAKPGVCDWDAWEIRCEILRLGRYK